MDTAAVPAGRPAREAPAKSAGGSSAAARRAEGGRRPHRAREGAVRRLGALLLGGAVALFAAGCATAPPKEQGDICAVFEQEPDWYDQARKSAKKWGTPIHVQMSFVRHESSYRSRAKPPRKKLWFIPLGRPSSAKGYAQAQDPVWGEYQEERGRLFRTRSDMGDALDFIGWYNHKTWKELGISRSDARNLYLAYHEGRGGYRRGTWKKKPGVQRTAARVAETAARYKVAARALRVALPLRRLVPGLALLPLSKPPAGYVRYVQGGAVPAISRR